jgi:Uma2 family endonuclease
MATALDLLTADEFALLPTELGPAELVRGRILRLTPPKVHHGIICSNVGFLLRSFVQPRGLGRVLMNDTGVITQRDPDTVRGPDVAYFSFARLPADWEPNRYADVAPEIAVEVRSPTDRWSQIVSKIGEFLELGTDVGVILDPDSKTAHLYQPDEAPRVLGGDELLEFPTVLPGFSVPVRELFRLV